MESLSVLGIYQKLKEKKISFLDYSALSGITECSNKNTLFKLSKRLEDKKVLTRLSPGLFLFAESTVSEFEIANYVYQPSYVSLESALSFYGILSQFTYTITSITTRKLKRIVINEKEYSYSKIDGSLYWGYEKKNNMLIATPEKALLDTLYFASKGISRIDVSELDFSIINKDRLVESAKKYKSDLILRKVLGILK